VLELFINKIKDEYVKRALQNVREFFNDQPVLKGNFKFFEITIGAAVSNMKYPHNLGFIPKDVIQLSVTGAGSLTWNQASFDMNYLDITTTGACVVRAFIGTYKDKQL